MEPVPRLFKTRAAWRSWLVHNHDRSKGIWLAYYKKRSGKTSLTYEEALEEALCFGWIDSTIRRIDEERYAQKFSPRNRGSVWSRSNKARIAKLIAAGRMAPPGRTRVEAARRDGSWDREDDIRDLVRAVDVPADLLEALAKDPPALAVFEKRPPSEKRLWAFWVVSAKKTETRARRVAETVKRVRAGRRPGM
jgi:uncharacterized protein YdeI (YjbR/CyaY-like superfamily)